MADPRQKHPYSPGWSWGNLLSAVAIVVPMALGGVGVYVALRVEFAAAAATMTERTVSLEQKVATVDTKSTTAVNELKAKVEKLDDKMNVMVEQQAETKAMLNMILMEMRRQQR